MPLDRDIKAIIWDLDNTLYRFENDFKNSCAIASSKAAIAEGVDLTMDKAMALAWESYKTYGYSTELFIERYKLDEKKVHNNFHRFLDEKILRACEKTVALFEQTNMQHCMLTHASQEWAVRAVKHLGLSQWFPTNRILALEEVGFSRKDESRRPFNEALAVMDNAPPDQALIIEDTIDNLEIPYKMGLGTILIHHGNPPSPIPKFVGKDYNNTVIFLNELLSAQTA